ncbi:hypothetical protein [Aquimonas voraii]|uniref:YCII-related domain-containing protein n=1 Tax=Aquimonas voraii TaxID=265719 RepID=A0A1G7ACL2_9GAMM|nr:hypothetical protein [Aquimonas voraii]SDE12668.1 hypothetical protein SAMN04488509_12311 [Aquimonas voraii]
MPYLALLYEAVPEPAPEGRGARWRLAGEALRQGPGSTPPRPCALADSRAATVAAVQWIEARDLNEALRLATREPLPPGCLLELHSLERSAR